MPEQAQKNDRTKPRIGLIASSLLWGIAKVMTAAVQKGEYPAHNWRKGMDWSTAYDALQRHLTDWNDGKSIDAKSGMPALWHAACDLMFLIEYEEKQIGTDDRYKNVSKDILSTSQNTTDSCI